jgi:hypothetical protein
MKFDPDQDYAKSRDAFGNIYYIQNGRKFNAGFKDEGKTAKGEAANVVERAKEKTKKLKGYREADAPKGIADAYREDRAAKVAEDNAP